MKKTFIERLVEEQRELAEKIAKLEAFLHSEGAFEKVGQKQYMLLSTQLLAMTNYNTILLLRINDLQKNS